LEAAIDRRTSAGLLDTIQRNHQISTMHIFAPAKINLHLRVGPPRADGFHPLLTWMTTVGLFDTITIERNPNAGEIAMTCSDPSLPCDDRNLVVKAAKLLRQNPKDSVSIHLKKKIPHGGGLGGGSSDAAFTLKALNDFWKLNKSDAELTALAAQLGSDIPFFLYGPSSICTGRGEFVRPIAPPAQAKWVLLILPALSMPTPAVYRKFDAMNAGVDVDIEPDWKRWAQLSSMELLSNLVNDLETPAFEIEPKLQTLRSSIEQSLGRAVRMSGSGSSLFTLYDHQDEATAAANAIDQHELQAIAVELSPPFS
jgi:4-diphosphocytidyl-2-C-methyl-D-erythritol kinase